MDNAQKPSDEVTKRILESSKETQKLKEELQALISAGISGSQPQPHVSTLLVDGSQLASTSKVQIIRSFDIKDSQRGKQETASKGQVDKHQCSKKTKTYNVEEVKEYQKKKRAQRLAECKIKLKDSKVNADIRKEKLQELQKKAKEIVKKNVELKRVRSNSHDRSSAISLNKAFIARSASLENINLLRNPNLLYPPDEQHGTKSNVMLASRSSPGISKENLDVPDAENASASHHNTVPDWLKEQPQGDPYNFINTVKRQLRYTDDRRPICIDVGVQGDLAQASSFMSHKHLKPTRSNIQPTKDGLTVSYSDHDSDTSKNIPSLSTESRSTRPNLDPCRVESVKLQTLVGSGLSSKDFEKREIEKNSAKQNLRSLSLSERLSKIRCSSSKERSEEIINLELGKNCSTQHSNQSSYSSDSLSVNLPERLNSITDFDCAIYSAPYFSDQEVQNREAKKDLENKRLSTNSFHSKEFPTESDRVPVSFELEENCTTQHSNRSSYCSDSLTINLSERLNSIIAFDRAIYSAPYFSNQEVQKRAAGKDLAKKRLSTNSFHIEELPTESDSAHVSSQNAVSKVIDLVPVVEIYEQGSISREGSVNTINNSKTVSTKSSLSDAVNTDNPDSIFIRPRSETNGSQNDQSMPIDSQSLSKNRSKSTSDLHQKSKLLTNITIRSASADRSKVLMKNITLRSNHECTLNGTGKEIQLKFEAEIHLLTDINQTISRLSDIEKTYESMRNSEILKSDTKKAVENKDTQTSQLEAHRQKHSSLELTDFSQLIWRPLNDSTLSDATLNPSQNLEGSLSEPNTSAISLVNEEAGSAEKNVYGAVKMVSLKMFDRMIKDEDARIENWKKMLKIMEQSLLDRTKGELLYLEMQKKELIETGKLAEASLIKKKQRGILLKHQQERLEMRRLKQKQKEDSHKRKALLKKDRKEVKNQLITDKVLSSLKLSSSKEKASSGPLKALQGSIHATVSLSETSATEATENDIISTISTRTPSARESLINVQSESDGGLLEQLMQNLKEDSAKISAAAVSKVKETLLMREHALAKRRKAVEELLQWHKKLLAEEKAIEELEGRIATIIVPIPNSPNKSVSEDQPMSQGLTAEYEVASSANYATDFENESVHQTSESQDNVSSISSLIEGFNKIQDNILNLTVIQEKGAGSLTSGGPVDSESLSGHVEEKQDVPEDVSVIIVEEPSSPEKASEASVKESRNDSIITISSEDSEIEEVKTVEELNSSSELEIVEAIPEVASSPKEPSSLSSPSNSIKETEQIPSESNSQQASPDNSFASSSPSSSESELGPQTSFKNKTDEEKAASLSARSPTSPTKVLAIKGRFSIASNAVGILNDRPFASGLVEVFEEASKSPTTSAPAKFPSQETLNMSPRLQPSECGDASVEDRKSQSLGTEAEELHRKQLAIEQEIKLLKEQQQKDSGSPFYVREIPNKPPPPYTPPSKSKSPKSPTSVIPETKEEVEQIIEYSAKIIHKAYLSGNLNNITISDNTLSLIAKDIDKSCYKYVFDLCKEIAKDHYSQFREEPGPSWLRPSRQPVLAPAKPLDLDGLKQLMNRKALVLLGFEKRENKRENAIIKWSRKKRDHVDEVLLHEMQAEDFSWTNFERDEALVKDRLCNELVDSLLKETCQVLTRTVEKKLRGKLGTASKPT